MIKAAGDLALRARPPAYESKPLKGDHIDGKPLRVITSMVSVVMPAEKRKHTQMLQTVESKDKLQGLPAEEKKSLFFIRFSDSPMKIIFGP